MYKIFMLCICILKISYAENFNVSYTSESETFLKNEAIPIGNIYRIEKRPYSEQDMQEKASYLATLGFDGKETSSDLGKVSIRNSLKNQSLIYDKDGSAYMYSNVQVDWLGKGQAVDMKSMESTALNHITRLLGPDATSYVLSNKAVTMINEKGDGEERIASINFFYHKKIDGRVIHGGSNLCMIEIASGGNIRSFTIGRAILSQVGKVDQFVAKSNYKNAFKISREKLNLDENGYVKTLNHIKMVDSYFEERVGSVVMLKPYISSYVDQDMTRDSNIKYWIHASASADHYSNLPISEIYGVFPTKP